MLYWIICKWHSFHRSDTYSHKMNEFNTYIANYGDVNALALFVADNPYVAEPILQLTMALYQFNDREKGMQLLKRILWIYEWACPTSFLPTNNETNHHTDKQKQRIIRFILSLDPLRDPMGVLLVMDYHALASMNETNWKFLIHLVQSKSVSLQRIFESLIIAIL